MNESKQMTIPVQVSCTESLAHSCKRGEVFYVEHEYISGINRDCTVCVDEPVDSFDRHAQAACKNKIQNHPITKSAPDRTTQILDGPPPILEVSQLCIPGAVEVYALLYESAYKDRRLDKRIDLPWSLRRDCGGTTEWSVQGISKQLHIGKAKAGKAINALLDAGFITVLGFIPSFNGSKKRWIKITKYNQLESVRFANDVMGVPYGKTQPAQLSRPYSRFDVWISEELVEPTDTSNTEPNILASQEEDLLVDFLE